MCGINGFNWKDEYLAKEMNNALMHRGPDMQGMYSDNNITLGHTRLSIIDLSERGKQPMSDESEEIFIVYNGEIYNFLEIKKELEYKGVKFFSNTDTEVVIKAYKGFGFECVNKFNGMWAFCIYDKRKNILFLSRDRMGVKPLYYYFDGKNFIFSSEIKGILKHNIHKQINFTALNLYLTFGYIPEPFSIYENIYKLKKGHNMIFDIERKEIKIFQYWEIPMPKYINENSEFFINEGRKLLDDAVRLRKIADVEVGTFLSGGLDSSAITATIKKFEPKKIHTFSIGFEEQEYDESKYAYLCADYLGTEHHHYYFKQKDFEELINKIAYYYDEPFSDNAIFPTLKISEIAKKYVTVILTGDGGDELFGGYPHYSQYYYIQFMKKFPKLFRIIAKHISNTAYKLTNKHILRKLARGIEISLTEKEKIPLEFEKGTRCEKFTSNEAKNMIVKHYSKFNDLCEASIWWDLNNTLVDGYLVKVDRASMANSIEARVPFMDYRFIEFSARIPLKFKVVGNKKKVIFKEIIKDRVPKEIVYRKKQGFTPPIEKWILYEFSGFSEEKLKNLSKRNIVDKELIDKCIKYINEKKKCSVVWNFISLELWCEKWI